MLFEPPLSLDKRKSRQLSKIEGKHSAREGDLPLSGSAQA